MGVGLCPKDLAAEFRAQCACAVYVIPMVVGQKDNVQAPTARLERLGDAGIFGGIHQCGLAGFRVVDQKVIVV